MRVERRGRVILACSVVNRECVGGAGERAKVEAKPFVISKRVVWEAWESVKANQGAAGVDEQSIQAFEADLKGNLYKLWNRLSSGSYMPPPVRAVEIPKQQGRVRVLGVPTVADRVAQTVVEAVLGAEGGARASTRIPTGTGRVARPWSAVGYVGRRCWKYDWVIDLDLQSFFDSLDHELVLQAVAHHTSERWILLYVERWLKAPLPAEDGTLA